MNQHPIVRRLETLARTAVPWLVIATTTSAQVPSRAVPPALPSAPAPAPAQLPTPPPTTLPAPVPTQPPTARSPIIPNAPVPGSDYFAGNLGISYQLVPYGRAYGARLTGYPNPGSPAAQLQLEPGDMIIQLDNQLIYGPNDVLNHVARTTVVFVNIRTGRPQSGVVYIPSGGGPYPPPQPPPAPYTLGVYVRPVIVYGYSPGQYPQRGLQVLWSSWGGAAARAGVRNGDVIYQADGFAVSTIQAMRSVMARSDGTLELWVFRGGRHNDRQFILVDMRPTTGGGLLRGTPAPEGAPSTTPPPEAAGGTPF